MKDKLYKEYGYKVECLIYRKEYIYFYYENVKYVILKTNLSEQQLINLSQVVNYLENYSIFFHQLLSNKNGFLFEVGNDHYVLLKPRILVDRLITIDEILKLSSINIERTPENVLENKIDFFEQYLDNYNFDVENINYFIGLSENSIALFNLIGNQNKKHLNHKRIYYNERTFDFYNPLNLVIDYQSRDLAEYAKSMFIAGNNKIIDYLKYLDYSNWYTYFARVLYPSYYFDLLDKQISLNEKIDKKRINYLANSFEKVLRELYIFINRRVKLPYIDWLSNVDNF